MNSDNIVVRTLHIFILNLLILTHPKQTALDCCGLRRLQCTRHSFYFDVNLLELYLGQLARAGVECHFVGWWRVDEARTSL
jgi:hypothetical protein